jgi:hypothetical protein
VTAACLLVEFGVKHGKAPWRSGRLRQLSGTQLVEVLMDGGRWLLHGRVFQAISADLSFSSGYWLASTVLIGGDHRTSWS